MSDIGISAIEQCKSRVTNPSTLVEGPRGFAVWHGPLRLTAWADAPFMVGEVEISRLHARTDFLSGFTGSDEQCTLLRRIMPQTIFSGIVRSPDDPSRLQLACSIYFAAAGDPCMLEHFLIAASVQPAEIAVLTPTRDELASVGLAVAEAPHPRLGLIEGDLDIFKKGLDPYKAAGNQPAACGADEIEEAYLEFERSSFLQYCVLETQSDECIQLEFPCLHMTSLVKLATNVPHPVIGNGLISKLLLPNWPKNPVKFALELNERELTTNTQVNFLGGWSVDKFSTPTFTSFVPNRAHIRGMAVMSLLTMMLRAYWVESHVNGGAWTFSRSCELRGRKLAELAEVICQEGKPLT